MEKLPPARFYGEWKGHPIEQLSTLHKNVLALRGDAPIVWLAGDSSLDNKAWIPSNGPAGEPLPVEVPDIYNHVLKKPNPKPDVAFWLNHFLESKATTINTAVEASLLRERDNTLLPHDEFIRDHIRPQDILIVSVGANDIALSPTLLTAWHMLRLSWLSTKGALEKGTAWSLAHFKEMFGTQVQKYIERLVKKTKPSAVVVCMIYYPLEGALSTQPSWADLQLKALGYNRDPSRLQAAIRAIYERATKKITISDLHVIPLALFDVMDGKIVDDYVERVEPSVEGGRKMGILLKDAVLPVVSSQPSSTNPSPPDEHSSVAHRTRSKNT